MICLDLYRLGMICNIIRDFFSFCSELLLLDFVVVGLLILILCKFMVDDCRFGLLDLDCLLHY